MTRYRSPRYTRKNPTARLLSVAGRPLSGLHSAADRARLRFVHAMTQRGRGEATAKFARRQPPAPEQARREAWGKVWGAVGADYKARRLAREGR